MKKLDRKVWRKKMNKSELEEIIIWVFIGLLIIGLLVLDNYMNEDYDNNCLIKNAQNYCSSLNYTYTESNTWTFNCITNERENKYEVYHFLKSEMESCKIKEAGSFKRIK